jgi:hypothetical protein
MATVLFAAASFNTTNACANTLGDVALMVPRMRRNKTSNLKKNITIEQTKLHKTTNQEIHLLVQNLKHLSRPPKAHECQQMQPVEHDRYR